MLQIAHRSFLVDSKYGIQSVFSGDDEEEARYLAGNHGRYGKRHKRVSRPLAERRSLIPRFIYRDASTFHPPLRSMLRGWYIYRSTNVAVIR